MIASPARSAQVFAAVARIFAGANATDFPAATRPLESSPGKARRTLDIAAPMQDVERHGIFGVIGMAQH